jgi:hypothetical protein
MTTVQPGNLTNVMPFPAIKPGYRLAPLGLGAPTQGQRIVYIECPIWCTEDHVANFQNHLDDVSHNGDDFTVYVPTFLNEGAPVYYWSAAIGMDPESDDARMRAAHVVLSDSANVDAYQTPDMADGVAADLEKLAAKIREAARTARLHNQYETLAVTA